MDPYAFPSLVHVLSQTPTQTRKTKKSKVEIVQPIIAALPIDSKKTFPIKSQNPPTRRTPHPRSTAYDIIFALHSTLRFPASWRNRAFSLFPPMIEGEGLISVSQECFYCECCCFALFIYGGEERKKGKGKGGMLSGKGYVSGIDYRHRNEPWPVCCIGLRTSGRLRVGLGCLGVKLSYIIRQTLHDSCIVGSSTYDENSINQFYISMMHTGSFCDFDACALCLNDL